MKIFRPLMVLVGAFCVSCGTYFNQPLDFQEARLGESTQTTKALKNLPPPEEKVVVGVYNFRDLTGQYKAAELGSTFSTAVTQGATSILIKALDDSNWFTPIERENIGNLLNERNIIRSTRQEYNAAGEGIQTNIPPLLYAGVLIEGGIVSYDTNLMTGGLGARYFGAGGSSQYRQDRVTIYLRAVSTSNGKILKNVYVSKTILSQAVDVSLFRYVNFQRLLEVETGITRNEPVQLAVTAAIEKAVESLVLEGIQDGLWHPQDEGTAQELIAEYEQEKEETAVSDLFNRQYVERPSGGYFGLNAGGALLSGDYSDKQIGLSGKIEYNLPLGDIFSMNLSGSFFQLDNGSSFKESFAAADLNAQFNLLPNDDFGPYLYAGPGYMFSLASEVPEGFSKSFPKLQYGAGVEYMVSDRLGIKVFAEHHLILSDEVDFEVHGKRDDHYFNFGVGLNFYLGRSIQDN